MPESRADTIRRLIDRVNASLDAQGVESGMAALVLLGAAATRGMAILQANDNDPETRTALLRAVDVVQSAYAGMVQHPERPFIQPAGTMRVM